MSEIDPRIEALENRVRFLEKGDRINAAWRAEHDGRFMERDRHQQEFIVKTDAAQHAAVEDRRNLWIAVGQMKVKLGFVIAVAAGIGSAAGALVVAMLSRGS